MTQGEKTNNGLLADLIRRYPEYPVVAVMGEANVKWTGTTSITAGFYVNTGGVVLASHTRSVRSALPQTSVNGEN